MTSDNRKRTDNDSDDQELDRLWKRMAFERQTRKGSKYRDRIFRALEGTVDEKLMKACEAGGTACGSVFCETCRRKKQRNMLDAYRSHVRETLDGDEAQAREQVRWVTVLHSAVAVKHDTDAEERQTTDQVVEAVKQMKLNLGNIARTARRQGCGLWLRGGIHIELVDYEMYRFAGSAGTRTTKDRTLRDFIDAQGGRVAGKYFLVHFHALVDKGALSDDSFRKLFTSKWSGARNQVHIQRTWEKIRFKRSVKKQSLDEGLKGMSRYCFNMSNSHLDYERNWGAGKVILESGEEVSAKGGVVAFAEEVMDRTADDELSFGDLRLLIQTHNEVNGESHRGLVVSIY